MAVWWKSVSDRKQESERSRMEIADTEAAVPSGSSREAQFNLAPLTHAHALL